MRKLAKIKVEIKGITPLLMDRFSDSAKDAILAKEFGMSRTKKNKLRNKDVELEEAVHYTKDKKYCFPIGGFKTGMGAITSFVGDRKFTKKLVLGSVFITNFVLDQDNCPCVIIESKEKYVELKHWIRHNVKFSPMLKDWKTTLEIDYDPDNITADDIVNCLDVSGKMIGIGAWRPMCTDGGSGTYGQYQVISCEAVND